MGGEEYITQTIIKTDGNFRPYSQNDFRRYCLDAIAAYRPCRVTNLNFSYRKFPITTAGQGCSTGGPPMAMSGNLNNLAPNFSHRWPGIEHTWTSVGSAKLTWPSVRCNGVSLRGCFCVLCDLDYGWHSF